MKKSLTAPFASLLGINRSRAARAEDTPDEDERKQRDGESDEDYARRMEELDERLEDEDQEEDDKPDAEGDEDEPGAEGDEPDDADEETDSAKKAARAAERARCARIIAHGIKIGAVRQAGVFAFDTKMSSKAAIAALNAGRADARPARPKSGLTSRMNTLHVPNPGAGGAGGEMSLAQKIIMAGKKRRGEA